MEKISMWIRGGIYVVGLSISTSLFLIFSIAVFIIYFVVYIMLECVKVLMMLAKKINDTFISKFKK